MTTALLRPVRWAVEHLPFGRYLAAAWFDEARLIVQLREIERVLRPHRLHGRVLNAGCGEGQYAPFVESFSGVTRIVNMDVGAPSIARTRADRRHSDHRGSLTALPFPGAVFDAVICTEVLEHITADRLAVAELARVLKPEGLLLLSVPTPPAPVDPAHVREGYTLGALTTLLASEGLTVTSSGTCFHVVMRLLYKLWRWQYTAAGRNLFPRVLLRLAAHLDRATRAGRPWDLIVTAVRQPLVAGK